MMDAAVVAQQQFPAVIGVVQHDTNTTARMGLLRVAWRNHLAICEAVAQQRLPTANGCACL